MNIPERDWDEPEFKKVSPQPLHEFKGVGPSTHINLPELAKNRKATNRNFCFFFFIFILLWIGFTIYILYTADVTKVLHGEDDCGNICGLNNVEVRKENCEPKDYRNYPILVYRLDFGKIDKKCMAAHECSRKIVFQRCFDYDSNEVIPKSYFYMVLDAVLHGALGYLVMVLIAIVASLLLYVCLRYCIRATLITILIVSTIGTVVAAIVLMIYLGQYKEYYKTVLPFILVTLLAIMGLCVLLFMISRFDLVCVMYQEALSTIFASPVLLTFPLWISLFLLVLHGFSFYIIMIAAFDVDYTAESELFYTRVSYLGIYWFVWLWLNAFVNGIHCMVIAGTAAIYYFAKEKTAVNCAFCTSLMITFRFHLGTIAAGSLIITIVRIAEAIEEMLEDEISSNSGSKEAGCKIFLAILLACAKVILCCFREIVEYLTKKAYIMTAIHGKGLIVSGIRAARLLWHFVFDTLVVDCTGFALTHLISFLFMILTMGVGYGMAIATNVDSELMYLYLFLGLILSGTITYFYASLLNVSIETIFLCLCEDRLLNDGSQNRPYFASKSLIKFITDAYEASEEDRKHKKKGFSDSDTITSNETPGTSDQRP